MFTHSQENTIFSIIWSGVSQKSGDFSSRPRFMAVKASSLSVKGVKVPSPDIFALQVLNKQVLNRRGPE